MMPRGAFLKGAEQRLNYLLQQVEREHEARSMDLIPSHLDDAQIKLASAKAEFLDFLYDRFVELEGSLVTPSRPIGDANGRDASLLADDRLGGREPRVTERL